MKYLIAMIVGAILLAAAASGSEDAYLKAASTLNNKGWLGTSIAASGDTIVVGVPRDASGAEALGSPTGFCSSHSSVEIAPP